MKKLKLNFKYICKLWWDISSIIFSMLSIFLLFISWENLEILKPEIKVVILIGLLILIFVISCFFVLNIIKENIVWKKGKNEIKIIYSDIFKIGFESYKSKKIVVIPVNNTFDTIIEEPGEGVINPLVSPNTIHGQWIKRYLKETKITQKELNNKIQEDLKKRNILEEKIILNKNKGNNNSYPLGTISVINGHRNSIFYLIAISEFGEKNDAHTTSIKIRNAIDNLIDFYDKNGQGFSIYIPLMGTGSSRADLTHEQSLKMIKSTILINEKFINGEVNIVVYDKDKDKISIFR